MNEARQFGADCLAEETIDISDNGSIVPGAVQRDNLRVRSRQWYVGKLLPTVYGERTEQVHSGSIDSNVMLDVNVVRVGLLDQIEGVQQRLTKVQK